MGGSGACRDRGMAEGLGPVRPIARWVRQGRRTLDQLAVIAGLAVVVDLPAKLPGGGTAMCAALHRVEIEGRLYEGVCRPLGLDLGLLALMGLAPALTLAAWLLGPRSRRRTVALALWLGLICAAIARSAVAEPLWHPERIEYDRWWGPRFLVVRPVPEAEARRQREFMRRMAARGEADRLHRAAAQIGGEAESFAVMAMSGAAFVRQLAERLGREPVPEMVRRNGRRACWTSCARSADGSVWATRSRRRRRTRTSRP